MVLTEAALLRLRRRPQASEETVSAIVDLCYYISKGQVASKCVEHLKAHPHLLADDTTALVKSLIQSAELAKEHTTAARYAGCLRFLEGCQRVGVEEYVASGILQPAGPDDVVGDVMRPLKVKMAIFRVVCAALVASGVAYVVVTHLDELHKYMHL
jgi:hypothetical protein